MTVTADVVNSGNSDAMNTIKPKKTSKGKARIPMQLISKKSSLSVSFSKRKKSLFEKAASLCSEFATDQVESAVIVFSPTGKPFAFGHPNPNAVIERFLGQQGIDNIEHKKEKEKGRLFWWNDVNVDDLNLEQLVQLQSSLEQVQNRAFLKAIEDASSGSTLFDVIN